MQELLVFPRPGMSGARDDRTYESQPFCRPSLIDDEGSPLAHPHFGQKLVEAGASICASRVKDSSR